MESSRSAWRSAWWRFRPQNCDSRWRNSSIRSLRDSESENPDRGKAVHEVSPHMPVRKGRKKPGHVAAESLSLKKRPCFRLFYCSRECSNYTSSVILYGRAVEEVMRSN